MNSKNQKPKIIQILQDREPGVINDILGLGDDGVVYCANWKEQKWEVMFPLNFDPIVEAGGDNE